MATIIVRSSALAALFSAVSSYAIAEMPTQTIGYGFPFQVEPTEAPSMELVKKSVGKRALTNTCTEWTIPGGFDQPVCSNSETCLFTAATDGYFYEGCGQTSIAYDWITECWPYPQTGVAPVSQIYCDADAPACGFLAFQFGDDSTYYNFGCSTESYSLYVDLLSTTDSGLDQSSQTLTLAGGSDSSITAVASFTDTDTDESSPSTTSDPIGIPGAIGTGAATAVASESTSDRPTETQPSFSGSSAKPSIGSHKKKKAPIGGIVGGVIGGLAVLTLLAFLVFFLLRKHRQDVAAAPPGQEAQQVHPAGAAAYQSNNNNHRVSEAGGGSGEVKPTAEFAGAYAPQQQYANGHEKLAGQQLSEYPSPSGQSPPPTYVQPPAQQLYGQPPQQVLGQPSQQGYAQPSPQSQFAPSPSSSPYPPSHINELDNGQAVPVQNQNLQPGSHMSVGPVSPVGTYHSNSSEAGGTGTYNLNTSALGGSTVGAYQPSGPPQNAQAYQPPPNVAEMSGNAASPRPARQSGGFDMNGAPLNESYGHHEMP